ncbi:hypothetical protein CsSME_00033763 [Camellia sinensis var. sinensis]
MEMARRWFSKFRSKDKHKYSKKETTNGKEGSKAPTNEEAPSNATKQKVAAAKQYIEKHYKEQMKNLQERKERYDFCAPSINEQANCLTGHAYSIYTTEIIVYIGLQFLECLKLFPFSFIQCSRNIGLFNMSIFLLSHDFLYQ